MNFLVSLLPAAGCGLMMWFCMRGMRGRKHTPAEPASTVEIDELRTEVARLRQQLSSQADPSSTHSLGH